jgi:hypothetical protein
MTPTSLERLSSPKRSGAPVPSRGVANDPLILDLLARAGEATTGRVFVKGTPTGEKSNPYAYMNEGKKRPD